jgi:ankyrin repeat protein
MPDGAQLHLPSLLHYPSSAPLMPLVLCERIDDVSIDRLHTLGLLPHMARLCAVARHPVDQKSALFFGWPELGTFADADASGPWFARHPWQTLLTVLYGVAVGLCALHGAGEAHGAVTPAAVGVRYDGSAWLLPCGSLHVRPSSGTATLGEKALARDADLRGVGRLLHELGSAGASAPPAVSVALLELAPRCEALELTMHEVAAKLADVFRMSVLDSSTAPARDLPPATQRWSRLRVLITAASAFTEAAATRALCLICLEEVSTRRGLACPEGHLICSACLQGYICSLAGSVKLRSSNGALDCLGEHQQPFSFCRSMVEPLLFGDGLRLYLETMETMETTETPDVGEVHTPESIQPELHKALNLSCPSCGVLCDPDPDGCIAMTCNSCHVAFCWLCFQACGRDAHPHCHVEHGGYFPPRSDVDRWNRRLRWRQVDGVLQRSFGGRRLSEREEALRICERNLADSKIGLWPFPNVQPSVGGMLGALPHVQSAQFGQIDELRALLDETPELIDRADGRGMTALMAAAHGGHAAVVTELLERGADVTCRDDRGVSALDYAIREDRQKVVLAILAHEGQVVNAVGPSGKTALMVAAETGHDSCALVLLEAGAVVNAQDNTGWTALMYAAENGHEQVALVLHEASAVVSAQDNGGFTALMIAAVNGHEQVGLVLLEARADPNQAKHDGVTALICAARNGHEQFAHVLLEAKAEPNQATPDGWTALILAALNGHEQVALVLLEAKADPNQAKSNGVTALICAAQNGHEQVALVLLEAKADPN